MGHAELLTGIIDRGLDVAAGARCAAQLLAMMDVLDLEQDDFRPIIEAELGRVAVTGSSAR